MSTVIYEPELRQQFHDFLLEQGFAPQVTPPPGKSYRGSHVDLLWQCYLHATLTERAKSNFQHKSEAGG